jgi:hypothetical protein
MTFIYSLITASSMIDNVDIHLSFTCFGQNVDKNPSDDGHSWPKHVKDNWMSTISVTLDGVNKLYIIVTSVTDQNEQS